MYKTGLSRQLNVNPQFLDVRFLWNYPVSPPPLRPTLTQSLPDVTLKRETGGRTD